MWYTYALKSLKDGHLYIGMSRDPQKRLSEHNFGMTKSTKYRRPFIILYQESCKDIIEARKREKYLKSGWGREFLKQLTPP